MFSFSFPKAVKSFRTSHVSLKQFNDPNQIAIKISNQRCDFLMREVSNFQGSQTNGIEREIGLEGY